MSIDQHTPSRYRILTMKMLGMLALFLVVMAARAAPGPDRPVIVITGVTIVDVEGGHTVGPRTVVIRDGHIVSIDASGKVPAGDSIRHVDGRGRFLIPGLMDMHVHLFNLSSHRPPNDWSFGMYIANGVTGVRDMRSDAASMQLVKQWRTAVDSGQLVAPHIVAAGIAVYGKSPEDAAAGVDAAVDAGADFIKVFSEVPATHWQAIVAEARSRSLPVVGHVPAGISLLDDARAGQRTSEHLTQAYEACSSIEARVLRERQGLQGDSLISRASAQEGEILGAFDRGACERMAKALARTGQVQVPTLVLADEDVFAQHAHPGDDNRWHLLRPDEQRRWQGFLVQYTKEDASLAARRWPIARNIVSIEHEAGVPIMAGTDSPMPGVYPGFSLHEELHLLVDAGLTPLEALRAATLGPARFLHIDDVSGSVAVGKRADLVLLDADPTRDIRHTQRIHAVVLAGRLLERSDLDALLAGAAKAQQP